MRVVDGYGEFWLGKIFGWWIWWDILWLLGIWGDVVYLYLWLWSGSDVICNIVSWYRMYMIYWCVVIYLCGVILCLDILWCIIECDIMSWYIVIYCVYWDSYVSRVMWVLYMGYVSRVMWVLYICVIWYWVMWVGTCPYSWLGWCSVELVWCWVYVESGRVRGRNISHHYTTAKQT